MIVTEESIRTRLKLYCLAFLIFAGLSTIGLGFVPGPRNGAPWPSSTFFFGIGVSCLFLAGVWMFWDHKRRVLTPDETIDRLLLEVAKRCRSTQSLDAIVAEYRTNGSSDETPMIIKDAPRLLKTRAELKMRMGIQLFATGIVLTVVAYCLAKITHFSHFEIAVGALGAGAGLMIVAWRERRACRSLGG